jgi:ATP-dependent Lon protease
VSEPLDLGLFPLDLVLLPGERVPLHLFEPRYRQLYADCVMEDRPFVILRTSPQGTEDVGCSARFETLVQRFEDGRLNVVVAGVEPVRVVEETDGRLYFSAQVEPLADDPPDAPAELVERVMERYRTLAGLDGDAPPGLPEGVPRSYAVASRFELPPEPKQELLEERSEPRRLELVAGLLEQVDREMAHARLAARRAATNGKVTTP